MSRPLRVIASLTTSFLAAACSAGAPLESDSTPAAIEARGPIPVANGASLGGRGGKSLDVQWLQWSDGSCARGPEGGGLTHDGGGEGSACKQASDCALSCNTCSGSDAQYQVAACLGHTCTSGSLAGVIAMEQQGRTAFIGHELCR